MAAFEPTSANWPVTSTKNLRHPAVVVEAIIGAGFIPVVAPLALYREASSDSENQFLNINADTVAGEIATALKAERLVFMTDVEGVMDSSRRLIPKLTERQARGMIRSNIIAGGMIPKIGACLKALDQIGAAQIIDGRKTNALKNVLSGLPTGTRIG